MASKKPNFMQKDQESFEMSLLVLIGSGAPLPTIIPGVLFLTTPMM